MNQIQKAIFRLSFNKKERQGKLTYWRSNNIPPSSF